MEEIKTRLQETSQDCFTSYEAWCGDKKNTETRETLQEAIHELRKVASRLEIEVATSERTSSPQGVMPIPNHRNSNRSPQKPQDGNNKNDQGNKPKRRVNIKRQSTAGNEGKSSS